MTVAVEGTSGDLASIRAAASEDHSGFRQRLRDEPVVIVGAGVLGRSVLAGLRDVGIQPSAFADNNSSLWGTRLEAVDIISPDDAARRFGAEAIFVMSTWRPAFTDGLRNLDLQLRELGCRNVVPFPRAFWAFPEALGPHYMWDQPAHIAAQWDAIEHAFALMTDPASRSEFAAQLAFRATAAVDVLPPIQTHEAYFPEFLKRFPDEHFVDCGAYNGDTIRAFLDWTQGRFEKITAFEADPRCYEELHRFASTHPEIRSRLACHKSAVAAQAGFLRFNANGNTSSGIAATGGIEVPAVRLDDVLRDESPTFIKMDIEGAELAALRGAKQTILRCRPVLAICVYHTQDHLWRVPLFIDEVFPGARYFLKSYRLDGLETVCYAIPAHRLEGVL
jgi:FkbM family methyltransferase